MPKAGRYIDATGKYVLPGAIDCHIHGKMQYPLAREYMEDWRTLGTAAAYAGLTTIIPFISYAAAEQETFPDAIRRAQDELRGELVLDAALHGMIVNTPYVLDSLPEAIRMGVTSYKMFMTYKKGPNMSPDAMIIRAMAVVARAGGLMQLHCESGDVLDYLQDKAVAEGRVHPRDFPATCPPWTEAEAVNRAILMGAMTDCPTYVVHLSTLEGLERIRQAQAKGQAVWTETCPHYLLLDESEMERLGPFAKIGPPLRPADGLNQQAMWDGLAQGAISIVASDHSPKSKERKEPGWKNIFLGPDGAPIPFGSPSTETLLPLAYSEGVAKRGLPITWLARAIAENPARIFGLYPRKGTIRPGSDADLTIIDPDHQGTITAERHHGLAGYTPYEGWAQIGRPWMTLLRGQVLLNDGRLEQDPGYGRYLPAAGPTPPIGGPVAPLRPE